MFSLVVQFYPHVLKKKQELGPERRGELQEVSRWAGEERKGSQNRRKGEKEETENERGVSFTERLWRTRQRYSGGHHHVSPPRDTVPGVTDIRSPSSL